MPKFLRLLYSTLYLCLLPLILLRLYYKSRKAPAYRERIGERLGFLTQTITPVDLWIHAVSLGEVVAATPLIEALLMKNYRLLITTTTVTGSAQVLRQFQQRVAHQYAPYDFPYAVRRFFKAYQPRCGVIMETEIWPNWVAIASTLSIPLVIANGRISEKALPNYLKINAVLKPILNQYQAIWTQSEADKRRFILLGASSVSTQVLGNLKFDQVNIAEKTTYPLALAMKKQLGYHRPTLILASTHDPEEALLLHEYQRIKAVIPNLLLFIAPRHPERFDDVYALMKAEKLKVGRRTLIEDLDDSYDAVLLDSVGELLGFYSVSDYAFVGGSFVPIGGHNILEPIAVKTPVLSGPYMQNSSAICQLLLEHHAMIQVKSPKAWAESVINLYHHSEARKGQINAAYEILLNNRGAVGRYVQAIEAIMSPDSDVL